MVFRVEASPRLSHLSGSAKNPFVLAVLSFICRKRDGIVWLAQKNSLR